MSDPVLDQLARPLGSLRLSVTDRCNMRCGYCMPEEEYVWLPRSSLLSFEEMTRLAGLFASLGAGKVRITGGEPLLRHDLPTLVAMLHAVPGVEEIALTTNGILLERHLPALLAAGLSRATVSLDTLQAERAKRFAKTDRHADTLAGIAAAREAGLPVKLNTVVIRGYNDDELVALLEHGRSVGAEVRFIEYMDVGGATRWSMDDVVPQREILARLAAHYGGAVTPVADPRGTAPAERFRLPDGLTFGVIASTTQPFCRSCDRSRLTADGTWLLCLYARDGVSLRDALRSGASDAELAELIRRTWAARTDRGAERRLELAERGALYDLVELRADPRREMHTRGG